MFMNLDISHWEDFYIFQLFPTMYKAHAYTKDDLIESKNLSDSIRYITRTDCNNGCEFRALKDKLDYIEDENAITIGDTTATCYYQDEQFIAGDHIVVLRSKWLNWTLAMFILTELKMEQYKYSYGRAFIMDRIANTIIKLPVDELGKPNWNYVEKYIKSLHNKPPTTANKKCNSLIFDVEQWKVFLLTDIFTEFEQGKAHDNMLDDGDDCIYLGAKKDDNCIMRHCAFNPRLTHNGNCIVFICNGQGSVGYTNYIDRPFIATTDLRMGYCDKLNKYNALFLVAVLDKERQKYSFGRKWGPHLKDTKIKLPAIRIEENKYEPYWDFMENYMKFLPYGDRI